MFNRHLGFDCIASIALCGVLAACDAKKPESTMTTPPTSQPSTFDWAKVNAPTNPVEQMEALTHIARIADAWHGGKTSTIRLRFDPPDRVADAGGKDIAFTPERWKGAMTLIQTSITGKVATRAVPSTGNHNYADGLGKAKRRAYWVQLEGEAIVLTFVKVLDGDSDG